MRDRHSAAGRQHGSRSRPQPARASRAPMTVRLAARSRVQSRAAAAPARPGYTMDRVQGTFEDKKVRRSATGDRERVKIEAYRAPMWLRTSRSAETIRANAPAMPGVLCPRARVFSSTLAGVRFLPVRPVGSMCGGMCASVASWTRSETGTRTGAPTPHGSRCGRAAVNGGSSWTSGTRVEGS